jgi:hypothetical protein
MRLGETLSLWNHKDKKCYHYETPYIAAPVRVLGDVIAKATTYEQISLVAPLQEPEIYLGSRVISFSRDPSCHIETSTREISMRTSTSKSGTRKDCLSC